MANNDENAKDELEKLYSILIKELEKEKQYYVKEKDNIIKDIKKFHNIAENIENDIKDIEKKQDNHIGKKLEKNLYPEYNHKIDVLKKKKEFYENIENDLDSKKNDKLQELDEKIEDCKKLIDKYNSDIDSVKQAIWRNGFINVKINEIVDVKELNEYIRKNEALLNYK